jgi:hypothetical protein
MSGMVASLSWRRTSGRPVNPTMARSHPGLAVKYARSSALTRPPLSRYTIRYPATSRTTHMVPSVNISGAQVPRCCTAAA